MMSTSKREGGGTLVELMTGSGENPRQAAQPQMTNVPASQTPAASEESNAQVHDNKHQKEIATASQSGEDPTEKSSSHSSNEPKGGATSNDNLGRKATDNISEGAAKTSTERAQDVTGSNKNMEKTTTVAMDSENDKAADTVADRSQSKPPAKRNSAASESSSSQKIGPVSLTGKSQLGMQPIAPAPVGGPPGMAGTPVPLAAAPPGSNPHTPVAAPSSTTPPSGTGSSGSKKSSNLRRGKWTVEEEAYVARVIQDFNSGFLNAPAGTTLRSYLSEKLQCDPMRITKKFTGESCIGKRVFHPAVRSASNAAAIDKAQAELEALERRWRRRLEMQQRESAKKAAASAAAAAAASGRSHGFTTPIMPNVPGPQNGVAQTATWLDRASNILKGTAGSQAVASTGAPTQPKFSLTREQVEALQSLPKNEIELQMKEVERLIHEGPVIQQTTAGLGHVPGQNAGAEEPVPKVPSMIVAHSSNASSVSDGQKTPPEPADKRMRTGAEDAEALVGFLTAVRASAAAGTDSLSG